MSEMKIVLHPDERSSVGRKPKARQAQSSIWIKIALFIAYLSIPAVGLLILWFAGVMG